MRYRFEAYDGQGNVVRASLEADTEQAVEDMLQEAGLTLIILKRQRGLPPVEELLPTLFGIRRRDLILFTRQLATLMNAGITIMAALTMLQEQASKRLLAKAIGEIIDAIQMGRPLSEAMAAHPDIFPSIYMRMVQIGEGTGNLELILQQAATYMEKEEEIASKLKGAMRYPAFVLLIAVGVIFVLVNFALPGMLGLFSEFGATLPLPTRILIGLIDFTQAYNLHMLVAVAVLGGGAVVYIRTERGREQVDRLMIRLPVVGPINLKGSIARMSHTASMLLRAGLPLTETMDLMLQTLSNRVLRQALTGVRNDLLAGETMSAAMARRPVFPKMLPQMVRVGEETGTLDATLSALATFFEEETDRAIASLSGMIEPLLIIFIGAVVGFIAMSVIMPMYSILQSVGGS